MTSTTHTTVRDDLFTHIHKALRLGLFEVTAMIGRTDWNDPAEVAALAGHWRPLLELLRVHTTHEDNYILRLLDDHDPVAAGPTGEQHRDLDDLLDDLADRFEAALAAPDPADGLALYRDLARFVAAYLPHLHDEETRIMGRIWECCTDDDIATTRARFMADTAPDVLATTIRYMLPAIDRSTRRLLVAGLAGSPEGVANVVAIAEQVFPEADVADLRAAAR